jgi:hypothetical protein
MNLPNSHLAVVEMAKLTEYLLNPTHPYGASKARFFLGIGFELEGHEVLAAALREHGQRCELAAHRDTPFGPRFEIEGAMRSPDGRNPRIRTVWQMDKGQLAPRLITAYPVERIT